MSMDFSGATSGRIDCGAGSSVNSLSPLTVAAWVYPTSLATGRRIFAKSGGGVAVNFGMDGGTSSRLNLFVDYGTTDLQAISASSVLSANTWQFVAGVDGGAGVAPKLFHGTRTSAVAEASSYTTQTTPAGSRGNDGSNILYVGNQGTFNTAWPGWIFWIGLYNEALSVGQLRRLQMHPRVTASCRFFMYPGLQGTGAQPDWSGQKNNGTPGGTTALARNAPIAWPMVRSAA